MGSRSGREISSRLEALRVYPDRNYNPREGDLIINWGNARVPDWYERAMSVGARMLNHPANVNTASNKLLAFRQLQALGIPIPEFTTDWNVASDWDEDGWEGKVYVRDVLRGHSGVGIRTYNDYQALPHSLLYVKGIENHGEYRLHVFNGEVIDYRKKRRAREDEPTEEQDLVRSHDNGWIFTMENLRRLGRIQDLATEAVHALGLDFGAVDIIKDEDGAVYVLEVNTACGVEGTTIDNYINSFHNYG